MHDNNGGGYLAKSLIKEFSLGSPHDNHQLLLFYYKYDTLLWKIWESKIRGMKPYHKRELCMREGKESC